MNDKCPECQAAADVAYWLRTVPELTLKEAEEVAAKWGQKTPEIEYMDWDR